MRASSAIVAFAVLLALAGCATESRGPPAGDATAPSPTGPASTTYPWGIADCRFVIAVAQVPASAVQPLLPNGFVPAPSRAPTTAPGDAEFHMDVYDCGGGTDLDGSLRRHVSYGSYYVPVVPPEALRQEGYDAYFVKLDTLEQQAERRETLRSAGFPIHGGDYQVTNPTPTGWTGFLHLYDEAGDAGSFSVVGTATSLAEPSGELPFVEYTPLATGGLARWHARLHDASIVQGVGTLVADGLPAEVLGVVPSVQGVPVTFLAGTWNLDEADVTFPVAWPQ